jgi:polyhydroxyalkanoate synthesis regulator phasin
MIIALISLVKEGKISTAVARMIVNELRQRGVTVPEELEELIDE